MYNNCVKFLYPIIILTTKKNSHESYLCIHNTTYFLITKCSVLNNPDASHYTDLQKLKNWSEKLAQCNAVGCAAAASAQYRRISEWEKKGKNCE